MRLDVKVVKEPTGGVRKERAQATRKRMLAAAYRLFCEQGYAPTTMAAIAEAASVAVQTLHFTFHTKAELLIAVVRTQAAGEDEAKPVLDRPGMVGAFAADEPHRTLALAVEHGTDIYARVAPLAAAIQTAASVDPDVAADWAAIAATRRTGMGRLVELLVAKGDLAGHLTVQRATDLVVVLFSHETFLGLTTGCGWTTEEYKAWLVETLCGQLLADPSHAKLATASQGLSYQAALSAAGLNHRRVE
jgi:AcrR family transcriptional regulator